MRGSVAIFLHRFALNFQLDQLALQPVQRFGLGFNFDADAAGGFVHQVNRLVRQLAIADVAMRELGGGDQRAVGDVHAMVHLVALL